MRRSLVHILRPPCAHWVCEPAHDLAKVDHGLKTLWRVQALSPVSFSHGRNKPITFKRLNELRQQQLTWEREVAHPHTGWVWFRKISYLSCMWYLEVFRLAASGPWARTMGPIIQAASWIDKYLCLTSLGEQSVHSWKYVPHSFIFQNRRSATGFISLEKSPPAPGHSQEAYLYNERGKNDPSGPAMLSSSPTVPVTTGKQWITKFPELGTGEVGGKQTFVLITD